MPSNIDKLTQILPEFLNGKVVLFIGAGLSKVAGCYDWDSLVKKMGKHDYIKGRVELKQLEGRSDNIEIMEFYKREFDKYPDGRKIFWGIIMEAILKKDPVKFQNKYIPLVKYLKKIKPFPPIITTNVDSCLEEAGIIACNNVYHKIEEFNATNLKSNSIFHIHGYITDLENSLFTKTRYLQRYEKKKFQEFLKTVFSEYSVLFLGYSLRDSEIKNILLKIKTDKKHFALVSSDDGFTSSQKIMFSEVYGIEIVEYGAVSNFEYFISSWIEKNFQITKY